jgi:DNA-binding winged helix-turn-helix (wHTH) protein
LDHAAATYKYRDSHRFGRFELQPAERRLLADGQPVALGARAFDLLVVLVGRAGQLVAKNDLLTLVWPGLVVEENNLQVQISTLRKVLGQSAFATIPGRGYRFELPVEGADTAIPAAEPSGSPLPSWPRRRNRPACARICPRSRCRCMAARGIWRRSRRCCASTSS